MEASLPDTQRDLCFGENGPLEQMPELFYSLFSYKDQNHHDFNLTHVIVVET